MTCIIGSTFLLTLLDNNAASDQFYQAGGRFGKRHNDRVSGILLDLTHLQHYTCYIINSILSVRCVHEII